MQAEMINREPEFRLHYLKHNYLLMSIICLCLRESLSVQLLLQYLRIQSPDCV